MTKRAELYGQSAEVNESEVLFKLAEETLYEREERYRHLFEQSPVGIGLASPEGKVVHCNRAMEAITGYPLDELKKINLADTYENPEERKALLKAMNRYGGVVNFPVRLKRKDGTPYEVLLTISRVRHLRGADLFQTICVDVTKSKQVERALQESEEKYHALAEHSPDLIMRFDRHSRILYVNPAITNVLTVAPQNVIEKTPRELPFPEPLCLHLDESIQKVFDTHLPHKEVVAFEGKAGPVIFDWQMVPELDADRSVETVMSTARDITDQKKKEHQLRERKRELEIKTNTLEELNTALKVLLKRRDQDRKEIEENVLLNAKQLVLPSLERLKKSGLNERQKVYASMVESALNDIISPFSRSISSTNMTFTPAEIQVANLVRHGKTTKDIAELLHLSSKTIEVHRKHIRRKIGIKNKRANLRSHLLSIH